MVKPLLDVYEGGISINIRTFLNYIKENNYKFSGIYAKFFLAMAIFMFVAILIVGFISYSISFSALTTQISYEKVNTLTQTRNTADVTLKEIEKTFIAESINPQMLKFTANPADEDYELLKQTVKELVNIKNSNRYIFSVYVYMPDHNMIVTTEDGFWKINDFYDISWIKKIKKDEGGSWLTTRTIKTFSGEKLGVVTYITPIPFDAHMDEACNLLAVNVYEKELLKLVQEHNSLTSGQSFIIDADGKVITHKDKELLGNDLKFDEGVVDKILSEKSGSFTFKSADGRYLASHMKSDYNKWNYISIIPEKQITKPILNLRVINIIVAMICMLLGLIAAYIVSSRIYRPISETILSAKKYMTEIGPLTEDKHAKNEMDFLSATIEQIVEKNKNLRSTMQKNEAALKEGFILDLLLSSSIDEIQLENKFLQFNISFPYPNFYVLVVLVDKYSGLTREYSERDRSLYFFGLKNISEEVLNNNSYGVMVQTDKDKFAAVLNCAQDIDSVIAVADKIRENIKNIFKFTVTIGISSSFSTPNEIGFMYNEAVDFAKSRIVLDGDRIISKKDIAQRGNDTILILSSREEQIFNNIKQGNINEAIKNIEKAVNTIRKEPGYPAEEILQFFYSILYTSIRAVNENGWSVSDIFGDNCSLYRDLVENDTVADISGWINEILMRMSNFIIEKKESKNYSLIESILNYMHANYNKDISLNSMADYVSLSTPYLSKLFKSETGENFLEYLTKLRIEKSKELLLDPDYKITTISEKVNFGNAQNYIRIFKKYEGMTPGQYREMSIKESLNRQ